MFHVAADYIRKSQLFTGLATEAFTIPDNTSWLYFYVVGGGGGGGGGGTGDASVSRGGGGSGGRSTTMIGIFPARVFPKTLYVTCGKGALGGAAMTNGSAGGASVVATEGLTSPHYVINVSGGGSGGGGSTVAGSAAGGSSNPTAQYLGLMGPVAIRSNSGSVSGGFGGNASGVNVTSTSMLTHGTGGGGSSISADFAGGNVITGGQVWALGTVPGGVPNGGHGNNGWWNPRYLTSCGGTGGGSDRDGTGGNGGMGGPGSGGGGGGSGLVSGGTGGNGGDGFVYIGWW